ncbi:MAG TPA: nucleotide sugar dehydrogenase, partial [Kiritimatiellia bacterium]|nr:nucleotide sugar dehydrogenase [Kiritimatiellia bacterium]
MNIGIIGLWHQGIVGAACLAEAGHRVVARDGRGATVEALRRGESPIYEPGLDDLLRAGLASGRLSFTESVAEAVSGAEVVFLMHDTPVDEQDFSDLSGVFGDVEAMIPHLGEGVTLVVTAQVQVGTCDQMGRRIEEARPGLGVSMAYIPENLRLGQALERFRDPPLPVVGTEDDGAFEMVRTLFPGARWERVSLRTGEMVKHALNGFLATCVTFANEVGNVCDEVGADGHRLAEVLRMEPRVGAKAMLFPGLGFSGGTLARDVQTLRGLGDSHGLETPMLDGLWRSNRQQNDLVVRKLKACWGGELAGKRVAILGITYKPDTSTLRRSAALGVAEALRGEGVEVWATDPMADRGE